MYTYNFQPLFILLIIFHRKIYLFQCLPFSFLYLRTIKFPQQNINQSETRIGNKNFSVEMYVGNSHYLSQIVPPAFMSKRFFDLAWRMSVSSERFKFYWPMFCFFYLSIARVQDQAENRHLASQFVEFSCSSCSQQLL